MKKIFKLLLLILSTLGFVGCTVIPDTPVTPDDPVNNTMYTIFFESNGGTTIESYDVLAGTILTIDDAPTKRGYTFGGWYIDEELKVPFVNNSIVGDDVFLYAKWNDPVFKVTFESNNEEDVKVIEVVKGEKVNEPSVPQRTNYIFRGWYIDSVFSREFDFEQEIVRDITLYARWERDPNSFYRIEYDAGENFFLTKNDLRDSFYTDFYNFMKEYTDADFEKLEINNSEEFIAFCIDWNAAGRNDLYGVGDNFSKYYLTPEEDGLLENQPTTTFIGYCYQNGKYTEFLPFLIQFFAYWRTDEGYTTPTNHGNDFFYSSWAALVDTAKFFYFTSETLPSKYPWFTSSRVKDALDNIPNVLNIDLEKRIEFDTIYKLPQLAAEGYIFVGWYDNPSFSNEKIEYVSENIKLYAKWEKIR